MRYCYKIHNLQRLDLCNSQDQLTPGSGDIFQSPEQGQESLLAGHIEERLKEVDRNGEHDRRIVLGRNL